MVNQVTVVAAACLLVCLSVFVVDVVEGGRCPYIPFCDECVYNQDTKRAYCTQCEKSDLYGLTTENGFSRCKSCSFNKGCLKCKNFERCMLCRYPSQEGPDMDGVATCSACAENCRNCTLSGSGKCDSCSPGSRKVGHLCEKCDVPNCNYCEQTKSRCSACKPGFYLDANQCKGCIDNCRTCSDDKKCLFCNDYYFLETDSGTCKPCPENCKKCTDFGECQTCKISYYVDKDKKCSECAENCLVCMGKGDTCTYCKQGRPKDGSCSCSPNCKSCETSGHGKCDSCENGYTQSEGKGCKKMDNKD